MMFYAPGGQAAGPAVATAVHEHAVYGRTFRGLAGDGPPVETELTGEAGDAFSPKPLARNVAEDYNWNDPKLRRHYIRLEQKVLAKQASREENAEYQGMKRDRNGLIFADRQVRDYAEIQRLRKLAQTLAEVQKYLRPIEL